jgi:hypothetical protein
MLSVTWSGYIIMINKIIATLMLTLLLSSKASAAEFKMINETAYVLCSIKLKSSDDLYVIGVQGEGHQSVDFTFYSLEIQQPDGVSLEINANDKQYKFEGFVADSDLSTRFRAPFSDVVRILKSKHFNYTVNGSEPKKVSDQVERSVLLKFDKFLK